MPAYNFKKQFADSVKYGTKRQTIRAKRKDNRCPKQGQALYMYTGMRTKNCRKIGEFVCRSVDAIKIDRGSIQIGPNDYHILNLNKFAILDGFESASDLFDFFEKTHGLPFEGLLIRW